MSGGTVTIELGWPARQLSPNCGVHHMTRHRFKKAAKSTAYWLTKEALHGAKFEHDGEIVIGIAAHPIRGKARPDADNLLASMKAFLDGIALGLGVDDKYFRPQAIEWAEPVPHGKLIVSVS